MICGFSVFLSRSDNESFTTRHSAHRDFRVQLILALRFPSASERLNGFFGFVERGFSLRLGYPRLCWFTGTFMISFLGYRLAYANGLLLSSKRRPFQSAQFGSIESNIRTFFRLFDCLWFFSHTRFPLSSCISTFNILSLTCKAPHIFFWQTLYHVCRVSRGRMCSFNPFHPAK